MNDMNPGGWFASKRLRIVLAVGLAMAATGYFVGLRESRRESQRVIVYGGDGSRTERAEAVPEAVPYWQLATKKLGPNRTWKNTLEQLEQPPAAPPPKVAASANERLAVIADREKRRAFDGAPPVIPHPTPPMSVAACLACHEKGLMVDKVAAPRMSHPVYANCTQCHVEAPSRMPGVWENAFAGLKATVSKGETPGAPPPMPHPVWLRQECSACHGPTGPAALRTTHPERQNCLQCHAATSPFDRVPSAPGVVQR